MRMPVASQPALIQVVSVPHSGTRTLVAHLGASTHQHFYPLTGAYNGSNVRHGMIHIPIRHPMSVAESWARRGKSLDNLIERYIGMFRYLSDGPAQIYRIESLPRLRGTNDSGVRRNKFLPEIAAYQQAVIGAIVEPYRPFFAAHYPWPEVPINATEKRLQAL